MNRTSVAIGSTVLLMLAATLTAAPAYANDGVIQTFEKDGAGHIIGAQTHVELLENECYGVPLVSGEEEFDGVNGTDQSITVAPGPCGGGAAAAADADCSGATVPPGGRWAYHCHIEWHVE